MLGRFLIGLCFGAVGLASAFADPYGQTTVEFDNVRLVVSVFSLDTGQAFPGPGTLVSGTNVNVAAQAMLGESSIHPSLWNAFWTHKELLSWSFKIGGEEVGCDFPIPPPDHLTDRVRFASTHFPDGTSLSLTATALVYLEGYDESQPVTRLETIVATAVVTVHNKGLTWATREEFLEQPYEHFEVPNPEWPAGFAVASRLGAQAANATFEATNHAVLNPNANHQQTTESQLATMLKTATYVLGFTHGEPTNVRSSAADQLLYQFLPNQASEVQGYVTTNRVAPMPNIVVMHACYTMSVPYHAPYAFGVHGIDPNAQLANRAYAGYTSNVYSFSLNGQHTLDEHAAHLYARLAEGMTLDQALRSANDFALGVNGARSPLRMILRGDLNTRIISVYTGTSVQESWFLRL